MNDLVLVPGRLFNAFKQWVSETNNLEEYCIKNNFPTNMSYAQIFHLTTQKKKLLRKKEVNQELITKVYGTNLDKYFV